LDYFEHFPFGHIFILLFILKLLGGLHLFHALLLLDAPLVSQNHQFLLDLSDFLVDHIEDLLLLLFLFLVISFDFTEHLSEFFIQGFLFLVFCFNFFFSFLDFDIKNKDMLTLSLVSLGKDSGALFDEIDNNDHVSEGHQRLSHARHKEDN